MNKNLDKIMKNKLFENISEKDFSSMLSCLGSYEKSYCKNEVIIAEGDPIGFVGAVLDGAIRITKTNYDGSEVIIANIFDGDIFAEVFACAENSKSPASIVSSTECTILFFDAQKIKSTCSLSCTFHQQLISNMLSVVASKCMYLNSRIDVISKKTLRDKILTFLHYESKGRKYFTINMNREELASFLCADRSALSNELSKMKKDGVIDYYKNEFCLYST